MGRIAAGIGIAVAGHLPASGLWLRSCNTFVYSASPDTLFTVDRLATLLQLALLACCAVPGGVLVLNGDRGLGLGLRILLRGLVGRSDRWQEANRRPVAKRHDQKVRGVG